MMSSSRSMGRFAMSSMSRSTVGRFDMFVSATPVCRQISTNANQYNPSNDSDG